MKKALINNWFSLGADNGAAVSSAIAAEQLVNPDYDRSRQLSCENAAGLRWVNNVLKQAGDFLGPVLTQAQLEHTENLLAGDAGEQEVRQLVCKLRSSSFVDQHDVLLPYEYGEPGRRTFDNQIDSLVICNSGIYCLEVKTRNVKGTVFDFQDLAPGIYDQISYHQAAVQAALEAAGCAVDPNLIKSIVVVVDRGGKPKLTFKNQQFLVEHGARVVGLDGLSHLLSKGFDKCWLSVSDVQNLERLILARRLREPRYYAENVCFNLTPGLLNQVRLLEMEHRFGVPVEQNVTYNAALNDLSMAGLSGSQQNFFWLIVGQLFRNAGQPVVLTARELKKMGDYRSNEVNQFNKAMSGLAAVMRTMPFFASAEYESRKLTVTLKRQYVSTFSMYSSESISWNNLLFRKIGNKFGKTLFRKLVQCANDGYCALPIQDLRHLLGVSKGYRNNQILKQIDDSMIYLAPFFENLGYRIERGKSRRIIGINFSFKRCNPRFLLSLEHEEKYLRNIATNSCLTPQDKKHAKEIFIKNYLR